MTSPVSILREIHRLRRHAKNLQDEINRLPLQRKAQQNKVVGQEGLLHEAQEAVRKAKVATHEREVSLKATQQQVAKYEKQRNETTSQKEYQALQAEITAAKQQCQKIEDQILESMLAVDEQATKVPELEKELEKATEEAARFEGTLPERQAGLAAQLAEAQRQLTAIEVNLPADVRAQYERLVAYRNEDAMSMVANRTCTACYTEITAQSYNNLLMGQFVLCKACGRILYLPEQAE